MVPEDLAVWLEAVDPSTLGDVRPGLLCTRHADAMVVPKGWTLDDRREPVPRLFRIPQRPAVPSRPTDTTARLRRPRHEDWARLALFDDEAADAEATDAEAADDDAPGDSAIDPDPGVGEPFVEDGAVQDGVDEASIADPQLSEDPASATEQQDSSRGEPWRPRFDQSDDLDGLLTARSPLLRRAFGLPEGDDGRPR
jgi:hypothetical protein